MDQGTFNAVSIPAEEAGATAPSASPAPDTVPEKFIKDGQVDVESLAKSYKELEARLSNPQEFKSQQQQQQQQSKPAISVPGVSGENLNKYSQEFSQQGALSDQSYQELMKAGYPKEVVDAYIKGVIADGAKSEPVVSEAEISRIKESVGGEKAYSEMSAWAQQNLSVAERNAFNDVVNSNDPAKIGLAVNGLYARYQQEFGKAPRLLGGRQSQGDGSLFRSMNEMVEAMADPRYGKDEAYRKDVQEKLSRSRII